MGVKKRMSTLEDEILNHFEAEPLARFVYSRHEGQCYYSALTQCFYEVDHRTNLWVENKKGDILYKKINDIVKKFLVQKIQGNQEIIRSRQGSLSSEQYTSLIQENIKYEKNISKINGEKLRNEIRKDYQQLCVNNEFPKVLNVHPYQIAFQNGIYDLRQRTFREGIRDTDYLTYTLDYDYEPVNDLKKTVQVLHLLKMICNFNEEHMDYYLSILAYALLGIPHKEKSIYFLLGQSADNGKSTLFNVLSSILPIYVKSLDSQAMEESYEKKHKWIKAAQGTRIVWIDELRKNKRQDTSMLKKIGDGMSLDAEILYGTTETIPIHFKLFIISNHSPTFLHDKGMENRLRVLKFRSRFWDDVQKRLFQMYLSKR